MLRRGSTNNVLVLVDNYNVLANGCDSERPELDMIEFFNHITALSDSDEYVSVALGVNRDLNESDSLAEAFYRETKHSSLFNLVFECSRNLAGHSRDVHGQLNVIMNGRTSDFSALLSTNQQVKNVKFRLHENRVELFDHYIIWLAKLIRIN